MEIGVSYIGCHDCLQDVVVQADILSVLHSLHCRRQVRSSAWGEGLGCEDIQKDTNFLFCRDWIGLFFAGILYHKEEPDTGLSFLILASAVRAGVDLSRPLPCKILELQHRYVQFNSATLGGAFLWKTLVYSCKC